MTEIVTAPRKAVVKQPPQRGAAVGVLLPRGYSILLELEIATWPAKFDAWRLDAIDVPAP